MYDWAKSPYENAVCKIDHTFFTILLTIYDIIYYIPFKNINAFMLPLLLSSLRIYIHNFFQ